MPLRGVVDQMKFWFLQDPPRDTKAKLLEAKISVLGFLATVALLTLKKIYLVHLFPLDVTRVICVPLRIYITTPLSP